MKSLKQRILFENKLSQRLLNLHDGAAVAYSLKRLSSSFTSAGNLRGADNSTLSAVFKGNKIDEYLVSNFFDDQDVFFSSFTDQSGNNRNAIQASAGKQGRLSIAGVIQKQNLEPVLDLLGANLIEYSIPSFSVSAYTVYLKCRITNFYTAIFNQGTEPFPYLHSSVGIAFRSGGTQYAFGLPGTSYQNIAWVRNGTNGKVYLNGVFIGETNSLSNSNTTINSLLGNVFGSGMTGQFNTLIVYPTAHDASKVSAINYLL